MNAQIERTRNIEIWLGLLGTALIAIALGLYIWNEPSRLPTAQAAILAAQLDEAMTLYAENCAICHGLAGEGIGANPPLNSAALRTMPAEAIQRVIAEGRYNTPMPAWSEKNGGPLSDYQIQELTSLILYGDWKATQDRVVNLGLAPLVPFTTEPDAAILASLASLPDGATLQTGVQLYATHCVACHGADGLGTAIAPALNDETVRAKSSEELTRILKNGVAGTLMAGWSNVLKPEEVDALITLIQRWNEVPAGAIPAPDVPVPVTAESLARGAELYAANCMRCHGPEGQGTQRGPALNVKSFLTSTSDAAIQQIITLGIPGTSMPAWGDRMSAADIQAIVGFIRQWEPTAPEVAVPVRIGQGGPPWMTQRNTAPGGMAAAGTLLHTPAPNVTPGAQATAAAATQQAAGTPAGQGHAGQGMGSGQGGPPWAKTPTAPTTPTWFDWRVLALGSVIFIAAFALILSGYLPLQSWQRKEP